MREYMSHWVTQWCLSLKFTQSAYMDKCCILSVLLPVFPVFSLPHLGVCHAVIEISWKRVISSGAGAFSHHQMFLSLVQSCVYSQPLSDFQRFLTPVRGAVRRQEVPYLFMHLWKVQFDGKCVYSLPSNTWVLRNYVGKGEVWGWNILHKKKYSGGTVLGETDRGKRWLQTWLWVS